MHVSGAWLESFIGKLCSQGQLEACSLGHPDPYWSPLIDNLRGACCQVAGSGKQQLPQIGLGGFQPQENVPLIPPVS